MIRSGNSMREHKKETGYTRTTAVPLFWAAYGDLAAEPIVILHGGPGAHHDYLLPQMLAIASGRRLILYDQRGGGQSRDESREPITWQTHVADLAAVIDELGLGGAPLLGFSWGGLLTLLYLTELGVGRIAGTPPSSIVLIDPAPAQASFRKQMEVEFSTRQGAEWIRKEREELRASGIQERDLNAYKQRLFELSVAGYFHDPKLTSQLTPFRVVGRIQESVWKSLGDYDLMPAIKTLTIPALVVHGRDDPIPVQSSDTVAEALGARLLLLEKCGHVPYVEQPIALFSAIETFLDNYRAQGPE
jgi:pimeloyl-ACP methyl ester carboxylesterase